MKTKASRSARWFATLLSLSLGGSAAFLACDGEFEYDSCPGGTVQVAGGGDVSNACKSPTTSGQGGEAGSLGGGGQGGESGSNAGGGQGGGGQGGGGALSPVCTAGATKCSNDAQDTCDEAGQWAGPKGCDIGCDPAGSKCVVPVQLAGAMEATCALLSDGTVRCWGSNQAGKLGLGIADSNRSELKPVAVPGLGNVKKLSGTYNTFCALTNDEALYCWGGNEVQKFGTGASYASPYLLPERGISDVSASFLHLCIIRDSKAQCRGDNSYGELGDGTLEDRTDAFTDVLGLPNAPKQVAAGGASSCALLSDGSVYCWGLGEFGTLGQGEASTDSPLPLKVKGNVGNAVALSAGTSCTLRADETVVCWGPNQYGTLGQGTSSFSIPAVTSNGIADYVKNLSGMTQVAAENASHACALKRDGSLWCWGPNDYGQLGNACTALPCNTQSVPFYPLPAQVPLSDVTSVMAADKHTCAVTADGATYCWGRNNRGQLGNGETADSSAVNATLTRVLWK